MNITPFSQMTTNQINKLFELLKVHIYKYKKNQEILPRSKNDNIIAIILEGNLEIKNIDYNGNETVLESLTQNDIFGSNFSLINDINNQLIAKEDCKIAVFSYDAIMNPKNLNYKYFNIFLRNLFNIINYKFKLNNERARILEKKHIRDRLLEYFEIQYEKTRFKIINLPFTFKELADFIAVNRSAMFRELKNLKDENFIEVSGNKITLLYK